MEENLIVTEKELNSFLNNLELKFIAQKLKIENVDKSIITLLKIVKNLQQENKQLKEEIEIKDRLIDGIEGRLKNHFRKLDRTGLEDNGMLLKIQELIKIAKGDKE